MAVYGANWLMLHKSADLLNTYRSELMTVHTNVQQFAVVTTESSMGVTVQHPGTPVHLVPRQHWEVGHHNPLLVLVR